MCSVHNSCTVVHQFLFSIVIPIKLPLCRTCIVFFIMLWDMNVCLFGPIHFDKEKFNSWNWTPSWFIFFVWTLSYQLSLWLLQISRLIFTNSGNAILALASNAIHLLWKWQRSDRNSNGKVQGYQNGFHSSFVNFFLNKRIFWNDLYCNIILLLHSVGNCQCTTSVVATIKWHSYDKWCCWYKSGRGCTLFCFIQEWFLCNVSIWRKDFLV